MAGDTTYERLGGREGVRAVVDGFFDRMLADDLLGALFADAEDERLRELVTDFLCASAGAPVTYEGPPVRQAHLDVPLEERHVERAVELLEASLEEHDVPAAEADAVVHAVAMYEPALLESRGE